MFPWAKFRKTKGGIKLHTLLDHDGYIPAFVHVTDAKVADVTAAKLLKLVPGSMVVMDRGYVDFKLFHQLALNGAHSPFFTGRYPWSVSSVSSPGGQP
jgi:putative transposase